jgi:WD40 repeat protein
VIRAEDGTLIKSIAMAHRYVNSIRLSPDGKRIALIPERYEIEIWNVETGLLERTFKDSGRAYEAMFSADGKRLVTVGFNTDIRIWDTSNWKTVGRLPLRTLSGRSLALSRDGKYIAAVNADNIVLVWDVLGSAPVKKLKGAVGRIWSLTFSIDGKSLYAGDSDELSDLPTGAPGYIIWDIESGSITADRSPWRKKIMSGMDRGVVSPDGRLAAFSGSPSASGSVAVYSLQTGK